MRTAMGNDARRGYWRLSRLAFRLEWGEELRGVRYADDEGLTHSTDASVPLLSLCGMVEPTEAERALAKQARA